MILFNKEAYHREASNAVSNTDTSLCEVRRHEIHLYNTYLTKNAKTLK